MLSGSAASGLLGHGKVVCANAGTAGAVWLFFPRTFKQWVRKTMDMMFIDYLRDSGTCYSVLHG